MPFITDKTGNIILNPLIGWNAAPADGMIVLLQLQLLKDPSAKSVESHLVQTTLTPNQAPGLAAVLTAHAEHLLKGSNSGLAN